MWWLRHQRKHHIGGKTSLIIHTLFLCGDGWLPVLCPQVAPIRASLLVNTSPHPKFQDTAEQATYDITHSILAVFTGHGLPRPNSLRIGHYTCVRWPACGVRDPHWHGQLYIFGMVGCLCWVPQPSRASYWSTPSPTKIPIRSLLIEHGLLSPNRHGQSMSLRDERW